MQEDEQILAELFLTATGNYPSLVTRLPGSGSSRVYYRMTHGDLPVIGAVNKDVSENLAFFSFTGQFEAAGLPVPSLLAKHPDNRHYLLRDLGDITLYGHLTGDRSNNGEPGPETIRLYNQVIAWLPHFQLMAGKGFDFSTCYPRSAFDRRSMMWDLNYFKYYYLKLARIPFDEEALENDFQTLCDFLLKADQEFFMYRDFQSRNIMISDGKPWFIDYQGGRKGPLQYDVASLLYDAKADLPEYLRSSLLHAYLDNLTRVCQYDSNRFMHYYYGFVLIRILQAFGAYGFRGYFENKPHFLQSIPFALKNLQLLEKAGHLDFTPPALREVIQRMISGEPGSVNSDGSKLTVYISSFSYKSSIPADPSENGGGFVFDCRALPNPGREASYRTLSGLDQPIIEFLKREPSVDQFLNHTTALVDLSVKNYLERDFEHLMISFGCTGGQHRSVFCAMELASFIRQKYNVKVLVKHHAADSWGKNNT
jgi:aminoglycoside/choline kinase family phosphotransferase